MAADPGWCGVCGLPVPDGERFCRWPFAARAGNGQYDDEVVPWASHSLAFMTELVELQHWRCPWCGDCLPDSPRGTAIDHIIPRVYGGPHRRWNLQLLHQECNSAKGSKITAGALELAGAHGVRISMDIGHYRAGVRRRAAIYAVRSTLGRRRGPRPGSGCGKESHRVLPRSKGPCPHQGSRQRQPGPLTAAASPTDAAGVTDPCDPRATAGPLRRITRRHQRVAGSRQMRTFAPRVPMRKHADSRSRVGP